MRATVSKRNFPHITFVGHEGGSLFKRLHKNTRLCGKNCILAENKFKQQKSVLTEQDIGILQTSAYFFSLKFSKRRCYFDTAFVVIQYPITYYYIIEIKYCDIVNVKYDYLGRSNRLDGRSAKTKNEIGPTLDTFKNTTIIKKFYFP